MTSDDDRSLLLRLARDAIEAHVARSHEPAIQSAIGRARSSGGPAPVEGRDPPPAVLARPGGAFVTLHAHGDLRGCIGHIAPTEPLGAVVSRCAVAACSSNPRFPPVTALELAAIVVEISLLGPLEPVSGPDDVVIGRHGLVVERGWQRGLLLPQVAVEWQWDVDAFLAHTCHKAGLPRDAWRHGATVWRFEAEVFGER